MNWKQRRTAFSAPIDAYYFRPVLPILCAFIIGIIMAYLIPGRYVPALGALIFLGARIGYGLVLKKPVRWSPLILYICLGYVSFSSAEAPFLKSPHVCHYINDEVLDVTGVIDSDPISHPKRQQFILNHLEIASMSQPHGAAQVRGRIQVNIYGVKDALAMGHRIRVTGKIKPIRSFRNPGGFDYSRYMKWQDVWGAVSVSSQGLARVSSNNAGVFTGSVLLFRNNILHLIRESTHGDVEAVLSALIIGERKALSRGLKEAFNRAGVSHVLAISGLHVGMVASAAFFFFRWLLSFFRPVLVHAWAKRGAAVCALFPVILYGILAGMPPSTQRAVIMVSVFLMTFLIQRDHDLFNTIAVAALIILIIHPPAFFSVSFQLSFAAVLSISWGMRMLQPKISQSVCGKYKPFNYFATLFCVSGCAVIGVSPLVMHYFNTFSILGFLANLIVVPLMGGLGVILGLFSTLILYPVSPQAAAWGLTLCGDIIRPVIHMIYFLSNIPVAAVKTITPSILEIICFYALIWAVAEYIKTKWITPASPQPARAAMIADKPSGLLPASWLLFIVYLAVGVLSGDIVYWAYQRFFREDLRITLLDVGQGNAAVLELPKGGCMVVDGGGFGDHAVFDPGERVVAPFLWRQKIRTIHTLVLSHADADHLNGLVYLLRHFHVQQVISNHQASDSPVYQEFINLIGQKSIAHPEFVEHQRVYSKNGAMVEILHPDLDFLKRHSASSAKEINNNSIVLKAGFGGFSILFPGDIMAAAEKYLVSKSSASLAADILVSPHHGSKTSSSFEFLHAVNPKMILISCGKADLFPSKPVLARYANFQIPVLRTDRNGAICIVMDEGKMTIDPVLGNKLIISH